MELQRAETGLPQLTGHVLGSHPPNGPSIKHPQETIVQQGISQYVGPFRCFFLGGMGPEASDRARRMALEGRRVSIATFEDSGTQDGMVDSIV